MLIITEIKRIELVYFSDNGGFNILLYIKNGWRVRFD